MTNIKIEGDQVLVVTPEGKELTLRLTDLLAEVVPERLSSCGTILPDGVKFLFPTRGGLVLVHQTPPRLTGLKWIAKDSKEAYGPEAKYRDVRIALPYVILVAYFAEDSKRQLFPTSWNECFFARGPLKTEDDELLYPALLNCSKFDAAGKPLAWICTQYVDWREVKRMPDQNQRLTRSVQVLLHHLFETGFNYSSEHHEISSWFTETVAAKVHPALASIEGWEKASKKEDLFGLQVPWISTGKSLRQIVERIEGCQRKSRKEIETASDLMRLIANAVRTKKTA